MTETVQKKRGRPAKAKTTTARNTKKAASTGGITTASTSGTVTLTGKMATRFNDAKLSLNESGRIPFQVTNAQFMEMLLNNYESTGTSL